MTHPDTADGVYIGLIITLAFMSKGSNFFILECIGKDRGEAPLENKEIFP
jgi:hypothetical protein